jgi:hypothetical protein
LKEWLRNNPNEWRDIDGEFHDERLGILSGFPIQSVLEFNLAHQTRGHFMDETVKLGFTQDDIWGIADLESDSSKRERVYQKLLHDPRLTPELKEEMAFIIKCASGEDFLATSRSDLLWRKSVFAIKDRVYALFPEIVPKPED